MNPMNTLIPAAAVAAALLLVKALRGRRGDLRSGEARSLVAGGAHLVDVRTSREFAAGHLPGATNVPLQELERRLGSLGPKDRPIVVYCHSGQRSGVAKRLLLANGFTKIHNLGAMSSW